MSELEKSYTFKLSAALHDRIRDYGFAHKVSAAQIIRDAVKDFLDAAMLSELPEDFNDKQK